MSLSFITRTREGASSVLLPGNGAGTPSAPVARALPWLSVSEIHAVARLAGSRQSLPLSASKTQVFMATPPTGTSNSLSPYPAIFSFFVTATGEPCLSKTASGSNMSRLYTLPTVLYMTSLPASLNCFSRPAETAL